MKDNTLPLEIERKYLIQYPDLKLLKNIDNCKKYEITQVYLESTTGEKLRVREMIESGIAKYYLTSKKNINNVKRIEIESEITKEEYEVRLHSADPERRPIIKTRYCIEYDNHIFEIDIYPFWTDKAICEIELEDENEEIKFPDFINVIREVTDDGEYTNSSLAKIK